MLQALLSILMAASAAVATPVARAGEVQLIQIGANYPRGYDGRLVVVLAEDGSGQVVGFKFKDNNGADLHYTVEEIRKGVVLLRAMNKDVVRVRAADFDPSTGGLAKLQFLRRFMNEDRREFYFEAVHRSSQAADWGVQTSDSGGRDAFDGVTVKVASSLGIPQGVDEITLKNQAREVRKYKSEELPRATGWRRRGLQ